MRPEFCDHTFIVRAYYRRTRPGRFHRHNRWCWRCIDCHEYIGGGPIPSKPPKPPRISRKEKRRRKAAHKKYVADVQLLEEDFAKSGKDWDDYYDELIDLENALYAPIVAPEQEPGL